MAKPVMRHHKALETSQTAGNPFTPQQSWWIGIDRFVEDVNLEWLSPDGIWVPILVLDDVGRHWSQAPGSDTYRFTTARAGTQVWVSW